MLLLTVESLRPGMKLARPVLHPDRSDLLLLSAGYALEQSMINLLLKQGIGHAWISFPGLEELDGRVSSETARSHMELYRVLNDSIDRLEKRVEVKVNVQKYKKAVHQMLANIVEHSSHEVIMHQLRLCGPRLAGHQANCSYLALLVGAHLTGYVRTQRRSLRADIAENTAQLGLGALLHDVGKSSMSDELREVSILSPESAWNEYRYHTIRGYEEIREHISPVAAHIVLNHHQRFDGLGFPSRRRADRPEPQAQSGQAIHIFSRIVAAINVFDHLLCDGGGLEPVPTIVAMHELRSERFRGWFDPVVLEALSRLVPPFMAGQIVRLSDGTEAVVIENCPDAPTRPTVKPLSGPIEDEDTTVAQRPIDLRMSRTLSIAEIDGFDVRQFTMGEQRSGKASTAA